jgi:hypothetical protein
MFNATATSAASYATAPYSTPFILVEERDNRWKIDDKLKQTKDSKDAIPFLRVNDVEYKEVIKTKGKLKDINITVYMQVPAANMAPQSK